MVCWWQTAVTGKATFRVSKGLDYQTSPRFDLSQVIYPEGA